MSEGGADAARRTRRQLTIGLPVLAVTALGVWVMPPRLVASGEKAMTTCLDRDANPAGCELGLGFRVGALFPHARPAAAAARAELAERHARLVFLKVADGPADPARLAAAATMLTASTVDRADVALLLSLRGLLAPLAALAVGDTTFERRHAPAFAALALGDIPAARTQITRGSVVDEEGSIQSGALACLLGERARGLELIRVGADAAARFSASPSGDGYVAAWACGAPEPIAAIGGPAPTLGVGELYLARAFDPAFQVGRRGAIGRALAGPGVGAASDVAAVALAASSELELPPLELLRLVAAQGTFGLRLEKAGLVAVSPWTLLAPDGIARDATAYVPPAWLLRAAERYAAAARQPVTLPAGAADALEPDAVRAPVAVLQRAAALLFTYAATTLVQRGDHAGAHAALARARDLAPAELGRAPVELAAGEPAAALATIAAWEAAGRPAAWVPDEFRRGPRTPAEVAGLTKALALAAGGQFGPALAVAQALDGPDAAWLQLALATVTGAPVPDVAAPSGDAFAALSSVRVAGAIAHRAPLTGSLYASEGATVLPAVMVAIQHAAQLAGEDPEAALDGVLGTRMPSRQIARARAEAARWRKDPAAAARWDARAAAIEGLMTSDTAVVLAAIAGLW